MTAVVLQQKKQKKNGQRIGFGKRSSPLPGLRQLRPRHLAVPVRATPRTPRSKCNKGALRFFLINRQRGSETPRAERAAAIGVLVNTSGERHGGAPSAVGGGSRPSDFVSFEQKRAAAGDGTGREARPRPPSSRLQCDWLSADTPRDDAPRGADGDASVLRSDGE